MKLVTFAVLVAGAGCVAKSSGTIGQSDAQNAGKALAMGIEDSAGGFGPVSSGAAAAPSCVTLSGDTGDPDQDSIPNAATLTFNCSSTALGLTGTVTGTEMVTDDQPNAIAWAFTADAMLHSTLTAVTNASIVSDRNGQIVASQDAVAGPFHLDRTLTVTTVFTGANGAKASVDEMRAWNVSYAPQVTWTPGGAVVSGTVSATGSWDVTVGSASASATLATPTPLTLTPTCSTRVTAGTVTATYEGGGHMNTITVTWTGCGLSTVTYTAG